ncbi:hypothetical protein PYW07_017414 [Mythimna separata]|uniref:Hexosyltransferase n=1 Tax=Mythimna separata TaxID=271217 RepID=A0AAD7YVE7_MYTSE|nr:hypothetical protein PYW07_017414 [Mythimna separata]
MYNFFGISYYLHAKNSESDFDYPLNVDIKSIVKDFLTGRQVTVTPINYYPYKFLTNSGKCSNTNNLDLFIVVKSAMDHFGHRNAIRKTYGRDIAIGRTVKTLFFLGIDEESKSDLQKEIDKEVAKYKDIIQMDFIDSYFNNTVKTMMSFRWLFEHCADADYYLFTDDDMYISVHNLLEYVHDREATRIPYIKYYRRADPSFGPKDDYLFAGYVFKAAPQRFKTDNNWRVPFEEYPWDKSPGHSGHITTCAFVVSNKAMKDMYVASLFVKHFRFDDIYLAIVAKKLGITPTHCPDFHFHKKLFSYVPYQTVIASHGYGNHEELVRVWDEMND